MIPSLRMTRLVARGQQAGQELRAGPTQALSVRSLRTTGHQCVHVPMHVSVHVRVCTRVCEAQE